MNADDIRRSLDDTSRELLIGEPYFGHLLVGTIRAVATADDFVTRLLCAGHTVRLEVSAPGWSALGTPRKRQTALKHELLHLTFKHPLRARDFAVPLVYGLACDLVVNQLLDASQLEGAFTLADFPELALERDRTADYYYERLLACPPECTGSCDSISRWCKGKGKGCCSHSNWGEFAKLPSSALSVLETNVDALLEATVRRARCRCWGPLPAGLIEYLDALVDKRAEVPWRRVLRLFGATSERTYIRNTVTRPSKRYGTTPGVRVRRRTDLLVAVDTSGSVPVEDHTAFFSEIHALWRRGAQVTILECDARLQREYPYRGAPPKTVAGRGGTSFEPALQRANALHPDALIYFTDGFAPVPATKARMPVLWVLSSEGASLEDAAKLPGRRVKLKT